MKKIGIIRHYKAPKVTGETDMSRGISELKPEDLEQFKQLMEKYNFFVENSEGFENVPVLIGSGMERSIQSLTKPIEILYDISEGIKIIKNDKIAVYGTNTIDQKIDGVDNGFGVPGDIISHIAKQVYNSEASFFDNRLPLNLTQETLNATLGYFSLFDEIFNHKKDNFLSGTHGPTNDLHMLIALEMALTNEPQTAKKMLEYIAENGATKTGGEVGSYEKTRSGIYLINPNDNAIKVNEESFKQAAKKYDHNAHQEQIVSSQNPYK